MPEGIYGIHTEIIRSRADVGKWIELDRTAEKIARLLDSGSETAIEYGEGILDSYDGAVLLLYLPTARRGAIQVGDEWAWADAESMIDLAAKWGEPERWVVQP